MSMARSSTPFRSYAAVAAAAALVFVIFAANAFGRELGALFLRYAGLDKVVHFVGYSLIFLSFHASVGKSRGRAFPSVVAFMAGAALSVLDEAVQQLVPGRTVEIADIAADTAGLTAGWLIAVRPARLWAVPIGAAVVASATWLVWTSYVQTKDFAQALRYERAHDFSRALEHYRRALAAGMTSPDLYNGLAWVEIESGQGDPAEAVEHAAKALAVQPTNPDFLDTYGWALYHAKRNAEALRALELAYAGNRRIFCIHYHLGAAYLAAGQPEKAEFHFRRQAALEGTREAAFARAALTTMETPQ